MSKREEMHNFCAAMRSFFIFHLLNLGKIISFNEFMLLFWYFVRTLPREGG